MKIDLDFNNLYIMITKETGMTWSEIKRLDVFEFFMTIQNLEINAMKQKEEVDKQKNR